MLKKQNEQIVSHIKANDILGEIDKDNLFLANKVVSSRTCENRNLIIGKSKDLVYKLNDDAYLTLTDFNSLNEDFLVKRRINDKFDLEQYKRYVETNGITTFAGRLDLDLDQEDYIYLSSIQGLLEYGIDYHIMPYDKIIDELKNVNKFLRKYQKANLHNPSINPDSVKDTYVKANLYDYEHMVSYLNEDKLGNELSLLYSLKKHRM